MIKETFLHSEPNLCFLCADATTQNMRNILKNIFIQYNLHDRALKIKLQYDRYSLKESSSLSTAFNTTPRVAQWFFHLYCTVSPSEKLYRILIFICSEVILRQ